MSSVVSLLDICLVWGPPASLPYNDLRPSAGIDFTFILLALSVPKLKFEMSPKY